MSKKTKPAAKALRQKRHKRRQWITFVRMCRYGVNNFSRNAWLTVAATAVMSITLLVLFITFMAQQILTSTVQSISKTVDMSIYVNKDVEYDDISDVIQRIRDLPNTESVSFISSKQGREALVEKYKTDKTFLDALTEANDELPGTIRVSLYKIDKTDELEAIVKDDEELKAILSERHEPSFAGSRRSVIDQIGKWTVIAQQVGYVTSGVFVVISSLIVFNTIRMAIFSRKEEISMMKLIGADKSFIRGPFVVEASVYGFIAGIISTGAGYGLLILTKDTLKSVGLQVGLAESLMTTYLAFVLLSMIVIGAVIGILSSIFATARYLKVDKL